jgi:hypothetical protein
MGNRRCGAEDVNDDRAIGVMVRGNKIGCVVMEHVHLPFGVIVDYVRNTIRGTYSCSLWYGSCCDLPHHKFYC